MNLNQTVLGVAGLKQVGFTSGVLPSVVYAPVGEHQLVIDGGVIALHGASLVGG